MTILGHVIENDGSIVADFDLTVVKLWRSFWSNSGRMTSLRCPQRHRVLLLRRATLPIADQHMVRWPFTLTRARTIVRLQRNMLGKCCKVVPVSGESADNFVRRRRRLASQLQQEIGAWSLRWARQVIRWNEHLQRDPNHSWPSQLLQVRSSAELQQRRWTWGRPRTRSSPGFLFARWTECLQTAEQVYAEHLAKVIV